MTVHDSIPLPFKCPCLPILVWRWMNAPETLRALSKHGGDEDWVAAVPEDYADDWISWAEEGTPFGCCDVSRHPSDIDGYVVLIGAHA